MTFFTVSYLLIPSETIYTAAIISDLYLKSWHTRGHTVAFMKSLGKGYEFQH